MVEQPPSQRIVAEISRRIREGELRPGDRVPSTRRIAREWGVAMATATKALTTLRHLGLVRTAPRSGTIVAEPGGASAPGGASEPGGAFDSAARGSSGKPEISFFTDISVVTASPSPPAAASGPHAVTAAELTRERVVRAAVEIADAEGLDALSMRGIAARLGAATMSTYRHVADKDELIALMADAAYGEIGYPPDGEPLGWRERIERAARTLWTLYRRHPWLAQVDSLFRPLPLPHLLTHDEQILVALDGHGLPPRELLNHSIVLYSQIQGLAAHLEREAQAQAASGISGDEWIERTSPAMSALVTDARHPVWARMMATVTADGFDLDLDALFELALRTTLDGLALRLDAGVSGAVSDG